MVYVHTALIEYNIYKYKPSGTVQKSTVYLGSEYLGLSFLTSLNHQLFKNIAYVGYFCHFVICCICVFVYLYFCICMFGTWQWALVELFSPLFSLFLKSYLTFPSGNGSYFLSFGGLRTLLLYVGASTSID